jgi:hypothetical protein
MGFDDAVEIAPRENSCSDRPPCLCILPAFSSVCLCLCLVCMLIVRLPTLCQFDHRFDIQPLGCACTSHQAHAPGTVKPLAEPASLDGIRTAPTEMQQPATRKGVQDANRLVNATGVLTKRLTTGGSVIAVSISRAVLTTLAKMEVYVTILFHWNSHSSLATALRVGLGSHAPKLPLQPQLQRAKIHHHQHQ